MTTKQSFQTEFFQYILKKKRALITMPCSHDHSGGHGHHHHHAPESFNLAFIVAISLNLLYVIIQVVYAILAHSNSLLADAGHNFGDVLGLVFAFIASLLLKKKSSKHFSYGFKKTTILASIINALILVFTCGVIGYDAILKLLHPDHVHAMDVAIVAFIGILINGGTALLFMRGSKDDLNIKAAFMHLAFDALVSVGVVVGGIIMYFTHWYLLDPIIGIVITVVVLWGTWGLLRDSIALVMDGVPRSIDSDKVKNFILRQKNVKTVHDLHIWALSTKENVLTAHIVTENAKLDDQLLHELNHELEHRFKIHHTTIQLERDECDHGCEST